MNFIKSVLKQKTLIILLAILAIAAFFRFYHLAQIPPGLYPDVAINGNDALTALKTHNFKVFYPENNGREGLFINLIALSFWLFGVSVWTIKIVPAIFGLLTVLGIFFLTKQLFSYFATRRAEIIALLSTLFIAVSFWHVNFSRLGFRAIMVPFILVWSFYFLFKGLDLAHRHQTGALICLPLAGLFFGLGFYTYIAFRVAPLILLVPVIFELIRYWPKIKQFWRSKLSYWEFLKKTYSYDIWWLWDIFFLVVILTALPMIMYFWRNPADLMSRTGQISVFSSANPIQQTAVSAVKTLGQFVLFGDNNARHNIPGSPAIFWPLIPFFILGIGFSIWQIGRPKNYQNSNWPLLQTNFLLLIWWGAMLLPSIMTNEGLPHSLRSIGSIPPSYIFTGLGVWLGINYIRALLKNKKILFIVYCFLFIAAAGLIGAEYYRYFIQWGQNQMTKDAFTQTYVDEAQYLRSLPTHVQKYVLVNEGGVAVPYPNGLPMPAQTIIFFNRQTSNIKYFIEDPKSPMTPDKLIKTKSPLVILPMKPDEQLLTKLKKILPAGKIEKINNFEVFKINY
ncbi:MAG: hypothetical protein UW11_C0016G0012 [Parcubacteria group bacterium GW2011_GWA2_43_9b]|uniref:Glycosyltransferase RgtA/B/C/D-like domain-containing protein n=1 Tax=Candidatus Portnoybacteria bacterium RIFCSPLOWO2_02_FULL_39_11 TaxID=1802001 RepID=A0A1G2FX41_9BACT|nr:MAG: hypothetical protein UW11_C0016G0012 [Parcubacteria group bacterium GW2011_GWA2_43_9b]OGZ42180.1 MAG: hypothetical protein A3B04_00915 [Candidatus Portnoybacteria bacterium RIFCSPLOWO2_02_FULL_39_11]